MVTSRGGVSRARSRELSPVAIRDIQSFMWVQGSDEYEE